MHKIIDSNILRSDRLRSFLMASRENVAVLTDYAAMEAYKHESSTWIFKSMEILSSRPKQVIVLKGTQTICGLSGRRAGLQRRLIDREQTRGFSQFCETLRKVEAGNSHVINQVLEHAREAREHMLRLLIDAKELPEVFDSVSENYAAAELAALRSGFRFSDAMIEKLMRDVILVAGTMLSRHPRVRRMPRGKELFNTFIFRFALCGYILALKRISFGGAHNVSPEKLRNDMVDATFAAYGTFFGGLLTDDKRLQEISGYADILIPRIR